MKLIILDRDGVINHDSLEYIKSPDEWKPIPGSLEAIARLTKLDYTIAVATNQSGIARGLYDEATLGAIHEKMHRYVNQHGGAIDKIWYCPHMPDSGCYCRKPAPGMLESIKKHYALDNLNDVYFIGDRITDIEVAKTVGAKPLLIKSSMTNFDLLASHGDVCMYASLKDAVAMITK